MSEKNKFKSTIIYHILNENNLSQSVDYWEVYDEKKEYEVEEYMYDYGNGMRIYLNILYKFAFDEKYVLTKEQYTKEELKRLEPYCSCYKCSSWFFSPKRYLINGCFVGCIKTGPQSASKINVDKARQTLAKTNNEKVL